MKKQLLFFTSSLALMLFIVWSCDNGNADPVIIDGPPVIESVTVTGGTTSNTAFTASVVINDGVAGSTISTLASATWSIEDVNSTQVAGATESLSGDQATLNISVAAGFSAGEYLLTITVTDSNGNAATENTSFSVADPLPDFDISGTWSMEPVAGAFKVGPEAGSGEWWQNSDGDVAARACHFDDVYTFNGGTSGSFAIDMGDATWLETWQGVDPDQCGTPVDPFVSNDSFTYTYANNQLTLIGRGAAVGLAKVNNEGEISQGAAIADQITYNITSQTDDGTNRRMTLQIEAADGVWWEYLLISGPGAGGGGMSSAIEGTWKMAPEAGSLAVGPTAGSADWWQIDDAGVTARACFYDDTWTFSSTGDMIIDMQDATWLETWQASAEGCGAPGDPFINGTYSYTFDGSTLTVDGVGAFVGLQKVNNGRELTTPADAVSQITYNVAEITDTTMTLQIQIETADGGVGWWQFKLVKE